MQEMDVRNGILDVCCEVGDLAATVGSLQMIVDPADKDFFRR